MWVNHEYMNPLFVSGRKKQNKATVAQLKKERLAVGGSVMEVRRDNGKWGVIADSPHNRRFTADTPKMRVTGPAEKKKPKRTGRVANWSGAGTL